MFHVCVAGALRELGKQVMREPAAIARGAGSLNPVPAGDCFEEQRLAWTLNFRWTVLLMWLFRHGR